MAMTRPSQRWREAIAEEARGLATGELELKDAGMTRCYPEPLVQAVDEAFRAYEAEAARLARTSADDSVLGAVERVVVALNDIDEDGGHGGSGFDTVDREDLCDYIYVVLAERGIDVPALAVRNGMEPHEITDAWREW
ncbi:hypothetical protein ACFU99_33030 [Streptomyces sp. NPDC057654]|uniref:hypothetical protein n=1 Tax=Streptomyces sp. NPDC057654 TaxID=3346196 RepID=UPI00367E4E3E